MIRPQPDLTLASGDYLSVVRDFALSRGIQPSELLEGSDLSASDFIHPPELISNFAVNHIGVNLYSKLKNPLAEAVHYGLQVRSSSHGALGMAIQSSPCLRDGLEILIKFYNTRLAAQTPVVTVSEREVTLSLETNTDGLLHTDEVQRFFDLSTMVSMAQSVFLSLGCTTLKEQAVIAIDAPEPEEFPHQAAPICRFVFDAESAFIRFPTEWLDLPFQTANADLCAAAIACCEAELKKIKPADLVENIRTELAKVEGPIPSIDDMASRNFMSTATLKRRLSELQYSYQDLKNEVRLARAKTLLKENAVGIETIAMELGFSDNSNFTKFFKQHDGRTPKQYRQFLENQTAND
ncbi:hypothetical protein A3742_01915 [Oleiphilus sp. HI0071]|uniref:AraC family transcriptional regulator n=1 Tax=unclassified Oleiphilus TaxID=2631174 RepID=UPI0007C3F797|nr:MULTISPECIES: AraC family transcriptional regulator [unclassified Oleiphilus]KZY72519.1 hypothetical protein A3737_10410 [Oleiphilus sp. HI0065]KZY80498.1 hypothetical protein A3742_01915 [Oleiphilus sp. HI0071]KZZ04787.1 hypothetical protein A3744_08885 [Oleiphilus sp. HI0073]KZZ44900.1 hypothetical protein A3758_02850 [Oleiphilus sp. HI0118]KZZ49208.1 hypothetical protein A3760_03190 [Oleiphilus sp. HI0122]KZZ81055.1 hypothetical protein A3767_08395 [Oleiphilus sp. HI0133]